MNPHILNSENIRDFVEAHHNAIASRILNLSYQLGEDRVALSEHSYNALRSLATKVSASCSKSVALCWFRCKDGQYRYLEPTASERDKHGAPPAAMTWERAISRAFDNLAKPEER
jgi:hypothetical protein